MSALETAAALGFDDYDPYVVADAANELVPLGTEAALDRIALFGEGTGLFWVLRAAFEMPAGFPVVRLGAPDVAPPPSGLPRFPIVLALDVPILVVSGYDVGGRPETPSRQLPHFRERGELRAAPLEPSRDADAVLTAFSECWSDAYGDDAPDVEGFVRAQLGRA